MRNRHTPRIVLFGMTLAFVLGIVHLFVLRFEKGDVYPAYSSLRADPLGTKAFYLALESLGNVDVRRNHHALKKLPPDRETVLLYLGAPARPFFGKGAQATVLDRFVKAGGRICISFLPVQSPTAPGGCKKPAPDSDAADPGSTAGEDNAPEKPCRPGDQPDGPQDKGDPPPPTLTELWGFSFDLDAREQPSTTPAHPEAGTAGGDARAAIAWHSGISFDTLGPDWAVLYRRAGDPVVISRTHGLGTILMASDSYFLSNEALRAESHPELLIQIIDGRPKVIFDESHFGIRSQTGLAGLFKKYNLQGVFLSGLLCLGLFAWKRTLYFGPPADENQDQPVWHYLSTRDYSTGLTSLLRRNISSREILTACVAEWQKSFGGGRKQSAAKDRDRKHINQVVGRDPGKAGRRLDPVEGYNRICKILSEKKHHERSN